MDTTGSIASNGIVSIPQELNNKHILAVEVVGSNPNGFMAVNCGNFGARILYIADSNAINVQTSGYVLLRWSYVN